jgi:hypothetical protein
MEIESQSLLQAVRHSLSKNQKKDIMTQAESNSIIIGS